MKILTLLLIFLVSCGPASSMETPDPLNLKTDWYSPDIPINVSRVLPLSFSWTNADPDGDGVRENYVSSIKNQMCEDCYVYTAIGALEIQYQIDHGVDPTLDLSEQNIHNCLKISCVEGGDNRNIFKYIAKYGAIEEFYSMEGEWGSCESCRMIVDTGVHQYAPSTIPYFNIKWRDLLNINEPYEARRTLIVKALQTGPVTVYVGWGYKEDEHGIRRCVQDNSYGHSVVIVGYINYGEIFIVKNSHGESGVIKLAFDGGEKCRFGDSISQIEPGSTYLELGGGTKYCLSSKDSDGDTIPDVYDNCPKVYNPSQENKDKDILGDACDPCPEQSNCM